MILEPVTAIAGSAVVVGMVDRLLERRDRVRQRRRLAALADKLPPGSRLGENYDGTGAGWWVTVAPSDSAYSL